MSFRSLSSSFRLSLSALIAFSALARAQTTPAPPPPAAPEGTFITLGRYEVAAAKFGAQSSDLLTSVTVVGDDQLGHESADYTLELLGKIPGVTLTDFNQGVITADVSLRGFNGEGSSPHLRLLIDGLPANLNNGYNDLGPVFPLEIERIEVVKGPADPRHGLNAVAGTVAVHTFQSFAGQKLKLMAGDFGLQEAQALAGYRTGAFAQTYFAGYRRSDGYRDHAAIEKYSFAGKWSLAGAADRWRLGLNARYHRFDGDAPGYLGFADSRRTPRASPAFSSTDGGTQENLQFSLHGDAQLADRLTGSAKIYRHDVQRHRYVRFTAAGAQQERLEDELHTGATFTTRWRPAGAGLPLTVDAGAEFHRQDADNQRFATVARTRTATTRNHNYTLDNTGAFVGAELRPTTQLRLSGALRTDRFDGELLNRANGARTPILDDSTIWQPKLSASFQPHATTQLYASYGRAFQLGAGAAAYSARPLDASKNDGYELGLRLTPLRALTARLAVWRQTATDEIRLKPDNSGDSENIGETKRDGLDLELAWRAHDRLSLWASYTVQEGKLTNPGLRPADAALRGKKIDHIPDYHVKAGADWDITPAFTAAVSVLAQGSYHLTTANNTGRWGNHTLANLDLRYRYQKATFGLAVKNVLDRYHEYVWHDGAQTLHSPGDARAFLGSVTFEF
jgi:iron complex outermembrane receptor protein